MYNKQKKKMKEQLKIKKANTEISQEPVNIRLILSGDINEPIKLKKRRLIIPDVKVGVKLPKRKSLNNQEPS